MIQSLSKIGRRSRNYPIEDLIVCKAVDLGLSKLPINIYTLHQKAIEKEDNEYDLDFYAFYNDEKAENLREMSRGIRSLNNRRESLCFTHSLPNSISKRRVILFNYCKNRKGIGINNENK